MSQPVPELPRRHLEPGPPEDIAERHGLKRRPGFGRLRDMLQGSLGVLSLATAGLFVLALFYTLYFCRSFLLPMVLALLFSLLLSPLVRGLKRLRVPEPLGAGLVVVGLLATLGGAVYALAGPAYDWVQRAPQSLRVVEGKARALLRPVQTLGRATEQVEKIAQAGSGGPKTPEVAVKELSLRERLFAQATDLVTGGVLMFILLYFLLASGDLFLRKLVRVLPRLEDKRRATDIARQVQADISAYLATITVINVLLGLATWISMSLIGLPNPPLWGAMVAIANFIPYLGPCVNYGVLIALGFLTFPDLRHALLPAAVFLVLNVAEAYLLTPLILGRRLTLNRVVLFVGLTFWAWMWGIVGAILAVPIMVVCKILCDHIEPLAPLGEFLGE